MFCIGGYSNWASLQIGEDALTFLEGYYALHPIQPTAPPIVTIPPVVVPPVTPPVSQLGTLKALRASLQGDLNTLDGINLYASSNANGVFVNGIKVKTPNVQASNGVIHVISNVLVPPTETIADVVSGDSNFEILLAAVSRAGLVSAVSGNGKYTVFAPTDDAFAAAGFPDVASINLAPENAVAAIVKAHIIGTNVFASDLINASTAPTLQTGVSLTIGTTPASVKITGSANAASNVTEANITTTNGVIHVIDSVLL
jgi:uncharacterized surface protein with fasciclin (FAS1) repeats